jgi:hypothetical protein
MQPPALRYIFGMGDMRMTDTGRVHVMSYRSEAARAGISFGSALAIAISWSTHHSIVWAIIQGFFSWLYVIYYAITR